VFIDGASYKNDVLNGGITGQTTNRGNLFPENAVQEFRVVTNNFAPEYQYSTSGVIEATTKSGGNEWHGGVFAYGEAPWMIRRDFYSEHLGTPAPDFRRLEDGVNIGGPIIKDKLHVFLSYEGDYRNVASRVIPGLDTGTATARAFSATLPQYAKTDIQQFRQSLFFGKLTYDITSNQHLELSQLFNNTTDPNGYGNVDGNPIAVETVGQTIINDLNTTSLRYTWSPGHWLNEAQADAQWSKWNQNPNDFTDPQIVYQNQLVLGGEQTYQNFVQDRYSFHDNLTYSGLHALGDHIIKGGVSYSYDHYHIFKELGADPQFTYNAEQSTTIPISGNFGYGNPNISGDNGEVGWFIQDNWTVNRRLNILLGVRWDYESNEFENNFVFPRALEDTLLAIRDSHGNPMISSRFFNNGGQRPPFTGEWQPRASLTYDLSGHGTTVLIGNWGIFYDRDNYYYTSNEPYNLQWHNTFFTFVPPGTNPVPPGAIVWNPSYMSKQGLAGLIAQGNTPAPQLYLTPNDIRPPWSTNFSAGLRQSLGDFVLSGTYVGSRGFNGFTYIWGNRDFTVKGEPWCYAGACSGGARQIVEACGCVDSWYNGMLLKVEKPLTPRTRWGGWIAYTLSWAYQDGGDGLYSLDRLRPNSYPDHPTGTDQRSVLQANATVRLPLDFVVSGVVAFSSGSAYDQTNCQVFDSPITGCYVFYDAYYVPKHDFLGISNAFAYYQDDVRLQKYFMTIGQQRVGLLLDVFNVFDLENRACPINTINPSGPAVGYGSLTCAGFNNEGRTFRAGLTYDF
jgi:hypothetical protein